MIAAVILARVSSAEQEEGHSLDAQLSNLQTYAARKSMDVTQVFRIVESSTKGNRPEFERMIEFIGKQKKRTALIVDCVDRLQRSFTHTPVLNALMEKDLLEIHFVREGYSIDKDATSMQKLMWNMGTVMAQSYTDQLKDNIKRSIKHKIDTGHWIAKAPVGYRHEPDPQQIGRNKITIDPAKGLLVQRMFMEYATGTMSCRELQLKTIEWGLRTDRGKNLSHQTVCDMLSNPFYYGVMKVKGQLFIHKHPTLISKGLFDVVQEIRQGIKNKPWHAVKRTREKFLLRGLLTCAVSGKKVTCDLKKGKYIYLMARDPADPSKKMWIKEDIVLKQINDVFKSFAIPEEYLPEMLEYVRRNHESEKSHHYEHIRALQLENNDLSNKLNRLTDLLLEGHVTKDTYDRKHLEITLRRDEVIRELNDNNGGDGNFKLAISSMLILISKTPEIFKSSKTDEKRSLLGLVFSNLELEGSTLRYTLRKPFNLFVGKATCQEWCALQDSNL